MKSAHSLPVSFLGGFLLGFLALPGTEPVHASPKYGSTAVRLFLDREFIRKNPAPDYWALSPYYLPQQDSRSCSVASAAMVVNAARAGAALRAEDELVSQKALLEKVNLPLWSQGVGTGGRGIALDAFGPLIEASLRAYGFTHPIITTHHASTHPEFRKQVLKDLLENEKSDSTFIIVNYLQSEFTGDPEGAVGHYAPVAAFDSKSKKVLIFDPDRQYYEPYWVSFDTFIKGMNTLDSGEKKPRGYLFIRPGSK